MFGVGGGDGSSIKRFSSAQSGYLIDRNKMKVIHFCITSTALVIVDLGDSYLVVLFSLRDLDPVQVHSDQGMLVD